MAGKKNSGKEITGAELLAMYKADSADFYKKVLAKILFQPLAIDQNAEIARNTLNRTMIEGAVKALVKEFPETDEVYWLSMITDLKREQGYDK